MKTFSVTIEGLTPLLQHRFGEESEIPDQVRAIHVKKVDPREAAEKVSYRMPDKTLYLPGSAISRLLRDAGASHKQRGSRKSLRYIVPAAVIVSEDVIPLRNGDGRSPAKEFEVDSRPVSIPATKGRIMRHRPRLNKWSAVFSLTIDDEMMDEGTIQQLLTEGGRKIGVGDYRPDKGGSFGRFMVTEWKEIS